MARFAFTSSSTSCRFGQASQAMISFASFTESPGRAIGSKVRTCDSQARIAGSSEPRCPYKPMVSPPALAMVSIVAVSTLGPSMIARSRGSICAVGA